MGRHTALGTGVKAKIRCSSKIKQVMNTTKEIEHHDAMLCIMNLHISILK